jgi:peptidoglycan/LPS O-acetylase OafA/YrhL
VKIKTKHAREALPESTSLLLDFIRLTAAIFVCISHFTHPEFNLGYYNWQVLGDLAVPVFFVLSGFVIRYVTRTRESNPREYFIDRASRVYSVVLPALLFTVFVIGACILINREAFFTSWAGNMSHPAARILINLVFISQAWGHDINPLLSSTFWSLGYECMYYLLYGVLFFFQGWKRILFGLGLAALLGPQVLFLFPIWWLGCWVYDVYLKWRRKPAGVIALITAAIWLGLGAILSFAGHGGLLAAPVTVFHAIAGLKNPIELLNMQFVHATMFAVATGVVTSVALLVLLLAIDYVEVPRSRWWAKGFRKMADGTFAIYLMHYPFFILLLFLGLIRPGHTPGNVLAFLGMVGILTACSIPMDTFKLAIRRWLRSVGSH